MLLPSAYDWDDAMMKHRCVNPRSRYLQCHAMHRQLHSKDRRLPGMSVGKISGISLHRDMKRFAPADVQFVQTFTV